MIQLIDCLKKNNYSDKREEIENEFLVFLNNNLNQSAGILSQKSIIKLFFLYDKIFFDKQITNFKNISLKLSRRLTRCAGITSYKKASGDIIITFSIPLLLHAYQNHHDGYLINGIQCKKPYEALMRVMEHELVHVIEFILKGHSSCSKKDFKQIAYKLFGHTDTKHHIYKNTETINDIMDINVGDKVFFEFNKQLFHGTINRITRRATVLVPNQKGLFKDSQGNRFSKYYVPLRLLKKQGVGNE